MLEKSLLVTEKSHVDKHQKEFVLEILEKPMKVKIDYFLLFSDWQAAMRNLEDLLASLI